VLALAFVIMPPGRAFAAVGIGIGKTVCDVTLTSCNPLTPSYGITVAPGSKVQYNVTVVNDGNVAGPITITDQLQPGQTYLSSSVQCVNTGGGTPLVTCTFPGVGAGSAATAIIQVSIDTGSGGTITNTATASTPPALLVNSNQVTVNVTSAPTGGYYPPNYYPPNFYPPNYFQPGCYFANCYNPYAPGCYFGGCYNSSAPPYPGAFVQSPFLGTENICGIISEYLPAATGYGHLTVNGVTLILTPGLVVDTTSFTLGQSYCVTFTLANNGVITSLSINGNLPSTNYVCGPVTQYTPGYTIAPAYLPYAGYNPFMGYGSYPGYGPFPGYGPSGAYYGWGGPMLVGGYPYPVAPNTYFPSSPQYGNPYCFLTNQQGYVTGSLSAVPTAATAAEAPSGTRLPARRGGL
jgi:uncharacterized repeat protein (TIGR01451 family)